MADAPASATDAPKDDAPSKDAPKDDIDQVAAKADNPDAVRNALQAEREAAKQARERAEQLAAKVKEFEDRDKSDQEKLEERASTAEQRAAMAETKLLRYEVAVAKGVPLELADRLHGATKEEFEKDAERLLDLVKPNGRPAGDADARKGDVPPDDINSLIFGRRT